MRVRSRWMHAVQLAVVVLLCACQPAAKSTPAARRVYATPAAGQAAPAASASPSLGPAKAPTVTGAPGLGAVAPAAAAGELTPSGSRTPESIGRETAAGEGPTTARESLPAAFQQAQGWRLDAVLYRICGDEVGLDGKSSAWSYTFLPARGTGAIATTSALVVELAPNGAVVTTFEDVTTHVKTADSAQLNLDSPAALRIAAEAGGKDLRARYPAATVSICLEMESFESVDTPVLWSVQYADAAGTVSRTYFIKDATRQIQQARNDLLEQVATQGAPIAESEALEAGQRFALAWNSQARLGRLYTSFAPGPLDGSPTTDGKAPLWGLYYIAPLSGSIEGAAVVLLLYISAGGVEGYSFQEMVPDYEPFTASTWTIDALQAVTLAEARGGQAFRAANSEITQVYAYLQMDKDFLPPRLVWLITYAHSSGTLEVIIDAQSGELVEAVSFAQ